MQNVYRETRLLDKRAVDKFLLSEEILLENASLGLYRLIESLTHKKSVIYIVCGGGNNGADGLALARKLEGDYVVKVYLAKEPKTSLCEKELFRCKSIGVDFVHKLYPCDVVVDCLYGSGFGGELRPEDEKLIETMNKMARIRIACDLPSGVMQRDSRAVFVAQHTVVMGALKLDLFQEWAKDYVGKIHIADLGIARRNYETQSKIKLLEKIDLKLPHRLKFDTHKGDYGHLAILAKRETKERKEGASILSALAGLAFGAGKVTLVGNFKSPPPSLMESQEIPDEAKAIAFGMGAGEVKREDLYLCQGKACVLDADVFGFEGLADWLKENKTQSLVLTPHLKEFAELLRICKIVDLPIEDLKKDRFALVQEFCSLYPHITLVLKGTNTLIAQDTSLYICPFGSNNLAKAGSGDVLSGMIASLLAQGYGPLQASISGVLAHALASEKINTSYGLSPLDLIEAIKTL